MYRLQAYSTHTKPFTPNYNSTSTEKKRKEGGEGYRKKGYGREDNAADQKKVGGEEVRDESAGSNSI